VSCSVSEKKSQKRAVGNHLLVLLLPQLLVGGLAGCFSDSWRRRAVLGRVLVILTLI
jgi:hypothetical protein